jgi:hypothetical protein
MNDRITRVAAHKVCVGNEEVALCIVEIKNGRVVGYHHFEQEEANTEWIGGTINLRQDETTGMLRAYIGNKPIN